jgi:chromosome segregation ATPase
LVKFVAFIERALVIVNVGLAALPMADHDVDHAVEAGDVADVSNSTAFTVLEDLSADGSIKKDYAEELKRRYRDLHNRVLQIYSNDNFLLRRARQCKRDLESEKSKVERCGEVAKHDDESINRLKKELGAAEHELSGAQEKESMLQVEALELDRKKQTLAHDVEESIEQEEAKLKPLLKAHSDDIKELGRRMDEVADEFEQLKERREKLLETETKIKQDIERQNAVMYETKMDYARVEREPDRARKQADHIAHAAANSEKEFNNHRERVEAGRKLIADLTARKRVLSSQLEEMQANVKTNSDQKVDAETRVKSATELYEGEKQQHQDWAAHKMRLEEDLKKAGIAINAERDNLAKTLRDKEQGLKTFKKLEQTKADLKNEAEMFRKQLEILHREEARLKQQRAKANQDLEDLKREVDVLINHFLREEIKEQRCNNDKIEMNNLIRKMEEDVNTRASEEQQLRREASAFSIRREQMSRDCSRNVGKLNLAESELKVKDVVLQEFNKRFEDLEQRRKAIMEHYSRVKRERSAKSQLIQTNQQTMSETQEKIKILENELEVLRRESLIKDQDLKRKEREQHEHTQIKKNLLVESNRWNKKREAARHKEEDLKRQMSKLNSVITATEDEMLRLKEAYEDAVENRNYTGIQLIDRNDELCILYEKANIQETTLKQGMMQLSLRDEHIRKMAIELADLERDIDLCQKVLPQVRDLEEELAELMIRLDEERWKAEVLEHDLTDPTNATRWRKIGKVGVDTMKLNASAKGRSVSSGTALATTAGGTSNGGAAATAEEGAVEGMAGSSDLVELSKKQQVLEERLARVNEKLMEKDLILEEITELSNRLRRQALNGRDFTLALAKKVNGYQYGIKGKTKKMMATLSELSMVQASSIKLEMDVAAMEERVDHARARTEEGDAPNDDIERHYDKERANTLRRRELHQHRKERTEQELVNLPGSVHTTALARPNAYMQGDSELMLPQPYGAHGLFMPAKKHNVQRFYRKSATKPLDFEDD